MLASKKENSEGLAGIVYNIPVSEDDIHKHFPDVTVVKYGTMELPFEMRYVKVRYEKHNLLQLRK